MFFHYKSGSQILGLFLIGLGINDRNQGKKTKSESLEVTRNNTRFHVR